MDKALREFFESKKVDYQDGEALEQWLLKLSEKAQQLVLVTHNGKYTHPSVCKEVGWIATDCIHAADGYLRSGNYTVSTLETLEALDCLGNAAALPVYGFLSLELEDGRTVFSHLSSDSENLKKNLGTCDRVYKTISKNFSLIVQDPGKKQTSEYLKQVYFPIGKDGYHLLSVLTPACLIVELKNRIDHDLYDSERVKLGRVAKKQSVYHAGYEELYGLVEISYGGSNTQNIGRLNNKYGGSSYLLPSIPPSLCSDAVRYPKYDFFSECLMKRDFDDLFTNMYKLFYTEYNNSSIRNRITALINTVIDRIIGNAWNIQSSQTGWSAGTKYVKLPLHQKLWLDLGISEDRCSVANWFEIVCDDMARWICNYVPDAYKARTNPLGKEEFIFVRSLVENSQEAFL